MAMTNTHGAHYISQIQLPGSTTRYKIHDEDAIHSVADLGLSTPLNFMGIVETYDELTMRQGDLIYSSAITFAQTPGASGSDMLAIFPESFDLSAQNTLLLLTYYENYQGDEQTIEFLIDNIVTSTWESDKVINTEFDNEGATSSFPLRWDINSKQFSLWDYMAERIVTLVPSRFDTGQNNKMSLTVYHAGVLARGVKQGDVYLVSSTGQEYVALYKKGSDGEEELHWEPLGNVHDAASSKHTHSATIPEQTITLQKTIPNGVSYVSVPTYMTDTVRNLMQEAEAGQSGTAATLKTTVQNGLLTITFTSNTPTKLPKYETVDVESTYNSTTSLQVATGLTYHEQFDISIPSQEIQTNTPDEPTQS